MPETLVGLAMSFGGRLRARVGVTAGHAGVYVIFEEQPTRRSHSVSEVGRDQRLKVVAASKRAEIDPSARRIACDCSPHAVARLIDDFVVYVLVSNGR